MLLLLLCCGVYSILRTEHGSLRDVLREETTADRALLPSCLPRAGSPQKKNRAPARARTPRRHARNKLNKSAATRSPFPSPQAACSLLKDRDGEKEGESVRVHLGRKQRHHSRVYTHFGTTGEGQVEAAGTNGRASPTAHRGLEANEFERWNRTRSNAKE